jgi:hypothetical protein
MDTPDKKKSLEEIVNERLEQLPKVVQNAIRSGDVKEHMQKLAERHKLHVDQWESLEREVQFTLLGFQPVEELEQNIMSEVGVPQEKAHELAIAIGQSVFEPIREVLERELSNPEAKPEDVSDMETSRRQAIASEKAATQTTPVTTPDAAATPAVAPSAAVAAPRVVLPGTPPPPAPQGTAKRAPIADTYLSSTPSHERKTIEGDPYREQTT